MRVYALDTITSVTSMRCEHMHESVCTGYYYKCYLLGAADLEGRESGSLVELGALVSCVCIWCNMCILYMFSAS